MIAEIKKEFSPTQNMFFYYIYINGIFARAEITLDEAKLKLEKIKDNFLNPKEPEVIHTEEF